MANPFVLKLDQAGVLDDEDRALLQEISFATHVVEAREDLVREGGRSETSCVVMDGFAYRYKLLANGCRQIMAFLVPGDLCDLHVAFLGEMDHSIATLSRCHIVEIPRATIADLTANHPRITHALWWSTLVDEGILREWLVSMGQREADKQMAHFFCEMLVRLKVVGRVSHDSFTFPATQTDLADALGITTVHANRVLQDLRSQGLIAWRDKRVHIPDVERLNAFAEFDPRYLHLTPRVS